MSSIIMRVAVLASQKAKQSGLEVEPPAIAQIAVAALMGTGVPSLEASVRWGVPFFVSSRPYPALPAARQYPLGAVFDRAKQILLRVFARNNKHVIDPIELEVLAVKLGTLTTEEITSAGLCVHTQKLLFAPEYAKTGLSMLNGICDETQPPIAASVAIARGLIPPPAVMDIKGHLEMLTHHRLRGASKQSFAQWIASRKTFLVQYPLPDVEAGDLTRTDSYNAIGKGTKHPHPGRAELGLGFFVVSEERLPPTKSGADGSAYLHLQTPLLLFSEGESPAWSTSIQSKVLQEYHSSPAFADLKKVLHGRSRTSVVELKVCPECGEIYSDMQVDLQKRCHCNAIQ